VPHLHIHIVPRWKKDGLFSRGYIWKRQPYESEEDMRAAQEAIRSALKGG
jgi:diadenosine tetraphosphate (Ap4A) HIT family hydrolase